MKFHLPSSDLTGSFIQKQWHYILAYSRLVTKYWCSKLNAIRTETTNTKQGRVAYRETTDMLKLPQDTPRHEQKSWLWTSSQSSSTLATLLKDSLIDISVLPKHGEEQRFFTNYNPFKNIIPKSRITLASFLKDALLYATAFPKHKEHNFTQPTQQKLKHNLFLPNNARENGNLHLTPTQYINTHPHLRYMK